jgi:hypothetical protein
MVNSAPQVPWLSAQNSISSAEIYQTTMILGTLIFLLLLLHYCFALMCYHRGHTSQEHAKGRLPPQYPTLIPYLGPIIQVWLDHGGFLRRVSYVVYHFET